MKKNGYDKGDMKSGGGGSLQEGVSMKEGFKPESSSPPFATKTGRVNHDNDKISRSVDKSSL